MFLKKKRDFNEEIINIKKQVIEYGKKSLDLEKSREESIIRNCNTMITCNSILLVPLVTVFIELMNKLDNVRLFVLIFGLILVGVLFTSIFFAVWGQQLYKEAYTKSPSELIDYFNSHDSTGRFDYFYDQEISDLDSRYKTKMINNDKRKALLFVSNILNYSFYCLFFIFAMVIMILM